MFVKGREKNRLVSVWCLLFKKRGPPGERAQKLLLLLLLLLSLSSSSLRSSTLLSCFLSSTHTRTKKKQERARQRKKKEIRAFLLPKKRSVARIPTPPRAFVTSRKHPSSRTDLISHYQTRSFLFRPQI